jgi:nitrite reductase/ring-hydroxylating ferredoxin subunit
MIDPAFTPVMPLTAVAEGTMRVCRLGEREILLCHPRGGGIFALDNVCTHASARMSEGRLRGTRLVCPLHGASFDVRSGQVLGAPAPHPLATHHVRVVDGMIEVCVQSR